MGFGWQPFLDEVDWAETKIRGVLGGVLRKSTVESVQREVDNSKDVGRDQVGFVQQAETGLRSQLWKLLDDADAVETALRQPPASFWSKVAASPAWTTVSSTFGGILRASTTRLTAEVATADDALRSTFGPAVNAFATRLNEEVYSADDALRRGFGPVAIRLGEEVESADEAIRTSLGPVVSTVATRLSEESAYLDDALRSTFGPAVSTVATRLSDEAAYADYVLRGGVGPSVDTVATTLSDEVFAADAYLRTIFVGAATGTWDFAAAVLRFQILRDVVKSGVPSGALQTLGTWKDNTLSAAGGLTNSAAVTASNLTHSAASTVGDWKDTTEAAFRGAHVQLKASTLASAFALIACMPLDIRKTILQAAPTVRSSARHMLITAKQSPVLGLVPALVSQLPAALISFAVYKIVVTRIRSAPEGESTIYGNALTAAFIGDVVGSLWVAPFESVKQKIQVRQFQGMLGAMRASWRAGGLGGIYDGVFSLLARDLSFRAAHLIIFDELKKSAEQKTGRRLTQTENFSLGAAVGVIAAALTTPLDVVKTRMMTQRFGLAKQYGWGGPALAEILQKESIGGLFRGIVPRATFAVGTSMIFVLTYDRIKTALQEQAAESSVAQSPARSSVATVASAAYPVRAGDCPRSAERRLGAASPITTPASSP